IDNRPDYDYADGITFQLFELEDQCEISTTLYNCAGEPELKATVTRCNKSICVKVQDSVKPWSILWRGGMAIKTIVSGSDDSNSEGIRISPEPESQLIKFELV
ncbi:MAG TPA: hypothetical protein DDW65_20075, partial [Firmicutes bacterium]|nr:hypothetical protein [Bacillota bacterium]